MNKQDNVSMFRALGIYEDILKDIDWYIKYRAYDKTKSVHYYLEYGSKPSDSFLSIMHVFAKVPVLPPDRRLKYVTAIKKYRYLQDE